MTKKHIENNSVNCHIDVGYFTMFMIFLAALGYLEAGTKGAAEGVVLLIMSMLLALVGFIPIAGLWLYNKYFDVMYRMVVSVAGTDTKLAATAAYYIGLAFSILYTIISVLVLIIVVLLILQRFGSKSGDSVEVNVYVR